MSSIKERIKREGFYIWQDKKQREPRKDCQGKTCPLYDDRGNSMHCGHFFGGWCNHSKYGILHDKELIEVSTILQILAEQKEKWCELLKLIETRPKTWIQWQGKNRDISSEVKLPDNAEKCFRKIEEKLKEILKDE